MTALDPVPIGAIVQTLLETRDDAPSARSAP